MKLLFTLGFCLLFTFSALAQTDPEPEKPSNQITDRPTQSASAYLVPKGTLQIESGFQFNQQNVPFFDINTGNFIDAKLQAFQYQTTQIRFGITDGLELRISQDVVSSRFRANGTNVFESGTEALPTLIGARVHLANENGALPQISILANVGGPVFSSLPTGTIGDFRFNFEHSMSDRFSLGYNLGMQFLSDFVTWSVIYTLVGSYSLNDQFSVFAEAFGDIPEFGDPTLSFDFGLMYAISPNFQIDLYGGTGVTASVFDTIFGAGFSVRIPKQ